MIYGRTYRLEVTHGQDIREVDADGYSQEGDWLVFYRDNPQGGRGLEYCRFRSDCVVSMETKR